MARPRRPFRYWGMASLCVLFSLFGVLVIVAGKDAGGRLLGVMILLVFGGGGYAHISGPALTRHGAVTVRRDRVDTSTGSEPAFVFPSPRAKRRATAIGLGAIAVGTVGMLAIIGGSAFLVAGTAALCLVAIWALLAVRRRQLLALTPTRVVVETPAGTVEVPWTASVDAEIYPMPTGQATVDMVGLVATDAGAATWTRGRAIGLVNSRLSPYVVSIAADSFAGEGEDVVAAIRRYATDSAARRQIGGEEEHRRLLHALAETDAQPGVAGLPAV